MVEDDPLIRDVILYYLTKEGGYDVVCAATAGEALAQARDSFDVILLDIILPDANGIDLCERIRQWQDCPVIFVSCLDDSDTMVRALSAGGDAFVTKPFDTRVLTANIQAAVRRYRQCVSSPSGNVVEAGGLTLRTEDHSVRKGDETIKLSDTEYHLLLFLMTHVGSYFTPRELYRHVWGEDSPGDSRTVLVHIHNLRRKLEDTPSDPRYIVMVWGRGYTFVGDGGDGE